MLQKITFQIKWQISLNKSECPYKVLHNWDYLCPHGMFHTILETTNNTEDLHHIFGEKLSLSNFDQMSY